MQYAPTSPPVPRPDLVKVIMTAADGDVEGEGEDEEGGDYVENRAGDVFLSGFVGIVPVGVWFGWRRRFGQVVVGGRHGHALLVRAIGSGLEGYRSG